MYGVSLFFFSNASVFTFFFFFFQAEDGIRDLTVTGVQTCALPISLVPVDTGDRGNLASRLVHSIDEGLARERFAGSMARIRGVLPQSEVVVLSPASISFRRHGLEFAQARIAHDPRNFQSSEQI